MDSGRPALAELRLALVEQGTTCEPVTAAEIAEYLNCSQRTVSEQLDKLVEQGDVERKLIGKEHRVYWLPELEDHQEQLQHERDKLEQLLKMSPLAISVRDGEGDVVMANQQTEELLGVSEEKLLGEPTTTIEVNIYDSDGALLDEDDLPQRRALATGDPVFNEKLIVEQPHGDRKWYSVSTAPVYGPDDTIEWVITTGEDITHLKRREQELESELSEIFGRISDAFYALDDQFRFTHVNERAEAFLQHSAKELLGKTVWEMLPEATETVLWNRYHEAMESQEPTSFEFFYEPFDVWKKVNVYPSETGLSVYFQDVTDRVDREHALRESERRYRTLAENFPNGIVTRFDEKLRYTLAAGQVFEDIPVTPDDLHGRTPCETWGDDVADTLEPAFHAALSGKQSSVEVSYVGREWLVHVVPVADEDGNVFAGMTIAQDITEQVEREQQLKESNERLESFASMLAHELRNPVAIGQIYSKQLPPKADSEAVEYVTEAFERIEDMVDVLLVLARGREAVGESSPVNLEDIVREVWDSVDAPEATLEVGINYTIQADETYMRHLFTNLFENAVEHGGQSVTITVDELQEGFYLADDGVGIEAEEKDAIFETGYTTAAESGGSGLGLAFVRELVEVYEWDLAVTESEAGGAQFEFTGLQTTLQE